ncbi:MAG: tetratricopeptide repeat protein [Deinococcales bacterium]
MAKLLKVKPKLSPEALIGAEVSTLTDVQRQLFRDAVAALSNQDITTSISKLAEARSMGDNSQLAFMQGYVYQSNQNYAEAIAAYQRALQDLPNSEVVLNNLGFAYYSTGDFNSALNYLQQATNLNPNYAEAQLNYGLVSLSLGQNEQAIEALRKAISLQPAMANISIRTAESQSVRLGDLLGQDAQAITNLSSQLGAEASNNLSPESLQAIQTGLALLDENRFEEAAASFEQARNLQDSAVAAFYHGYALQNSGRPDLALEAYERAREEIQDSDTLLNNLGFAYYTVGLEGEALITLERAARVNPENAGTQLNLGIVNYSLERYNDAVKAFEKALSLEPNLASAPISLYTDQPSQLLSTLLEDARQKAQ